MTRGRHDCPVTRTDERTEDQTVELVWIAIEAAGEHGLTAEQIRKSTGLTAAQTRRAIEAVCRMRRTVPDVDAACAQVGERRLLGGDQAAEGRRNGLG